MSFLRYSAVQYSAVLRFSQKKTKKMVTFTPAEEDHFQNGVGYREKDGKRHAYWALVESYRTARGPRQRVVAYLGELTEPKRRGVKRAATGAPCEARELFDAPSEPVWVEVDATKVEVRRDRHFGGVWLGWQLVKQLGLDAFSAGVMTGVEKMFPGR